MTQKLGSTQSIIGRQFLKKLQRIYADAILMAVIEVTSRDCLLDTLADLHRSGNEIREVSMHWYESEAPGALLLHPGRNACALWARLSLALRIKLAAVALGASMESSEIAHLYAEYRRCIAIDQPEPTKAISVLDDGPPAVIVIEFDDGTGDLREGSTAAA